MSIRVLRTADYEEVMYDSVSMRAFGPVFDSYHTDYGLDEFIEWLEREYSQKDAKWFHDCRKLEFDAAYREWLKEMKVAA